MHVYSVIDNVRFQLHIISLFKYNFVDDVSQTYFRINDTSGEIRLYSSIENFDQDTIKLNVIFSDNGFEPRSDLVQVKLIILNR